MSTDCLTKPPETNYVLVNEHEYMLDEDLYNTLKRNIQNKFQLQNR